MTTMTKTKMIIKQIMMEMVTLTANLKILKRLIILKYHQDKTCRRNNGHKDKFLYAKFETSLVN